MTMFESFLYMFFSGISSIALLIVLNLLLPDKVERIQNKLEGRYIRSFVIGLIGLGLSFAILLLLYYILNLPLYGIMADQRRPITNIIVFEHLLIPGILILLAIVIAICTIAISIIGLAALANGLGQRIKKARKSLNPNLSGATLVVLSGLAPFLGWFVFAPIALCLSYGSTVQVLFQRKATPKTLE
jgi:hypothetical protein